MDKAAMVNLDIDRGTEIVDVFERAHVKMAVALWAYLPEYEDWRLVIASRQFDSLDLLEAYSLLGDTLTAGGFTPRDIPTIMILRMRDPFIRELRRLFGKASSTTGMRIGGQLIGDRFVEDGYVYRIS